MADTEKKSYKHTLNLPTTSFSIRAGAAEKEPAMREKWANGITDQYFANGGEPFVFHDGPPYANGNIHMGTALNKTLKDLTIRVAHSQGKKVSFRPGWDCHGLPIELKVIGEKGAELRQQDPVAFKKACRDYAQHWKQTQEEQFKQLGVFAQWENPYLTMTPDYEANILRSFATFIEKGHIERKGKTIPWCFSCQTVLANIEIEYADRKDPSCYVLFDAVDKSFDGHSLSFLIWTTTPWTIPLNRAVVLHPDATYAVVQIEEGRAAIVGADLVEKLAATFDRELPVLATLHSSELIGLKAQHPIVDDLQVPIISDHGVSTTDGTACLHSAPGCGPDDYLMGLKNGLEIYSPLAADGTYTDEMKPKELIGMPITDGQWWVLKQLKERGALLHKASIKHSYPHCWRCQNGLMFRATDQWFCNLAHNNLVDRAQAALDDLNFVPSWGKTRLKSFLENRTEWCISRQRSWGMPIPALFDTNTEKEYTSAAFVNAIADKVATHGIEYWDVVTVADLRAANLLPAELAVLPDDQIRKETDILDVWFDSGVSHEAVITRDGKKLPVDLYLEGSDQHRGWFQSSVLSSMVLNDALPMKLLLTHGFVVDEKGLKMSKSRGNVLDPLVIIKKYGADVMRLWVASVDYESDVSISPQMMDQVAENYRKLRNTCRFLLANLYDFNPKNDCVDFGEMRLIDRQAVASAQSLNKQVQELYAKYSFAQIVQIVTRYCIVELSSQYLDVSKDRLYVEKADSHARRSVQTAQHHILEILMRLLAPILVYTAEDVHMSIPYQTTSDSVHLLNFLSVQELSAGSDELWATLHAMRENILRAIEQQRAQGVIKHSLEATIVISADGEVSAAIKQLSSLLGEQSIESFFKEWLIVSQFSISKESMGETQLDGLLVDVALAAGVKCPRCWHWSESTHDDGLCERCDNITGAV